MAIEDLARMKNRLTAMFDQVVDIAQEDLDTATISNRTLAAELLKSAAEIAKAVAAIEREERNAGAEDKLGKLKAPANRPG
jgi:hypothetical protein